MESSVAKRRKIPIYHVISCLYLVCFSHSIVKYKPLKLRGIKNYTFRNKVALLVSQFSLSLSLSLSLCLRLSVSVSLSLKSRTPIRVGHFVIDCRNRPELSITQTEVLTSTATARMAKTHRNLTCCTHPN